MASCLEWSIEELIDNLGSFLIGDEASGQNETVGIVVLTCEMCNLLAPA